jgi:hypothetical protein
MSTGLWGRRVLWSHCLVHCLTGGREVDNKGRAQGCEPGGGGVSTRNNHEVTSQRAVTARGHDVIIVHN